MILKGVSMNVPYPRFVVFCARYSPTLEPVELWKARSREQGLSEKATAWSDWHRLTAGVSARNRTYKCESLFQRGNSIRGSVGGVNLEGG